MTDDNSSDLETLRIDRQRAAMMPEPKYSRNDGNGGYKRVLEALIVLAVAALIGAVWNLMQTATLLHASQESLRRDVDRVERRVDTIEGRNLRGGPDALDQQ